MPRVSVLKGMLQTFFAFHGDALKHLQCSVWKQEQREIEWGLWLYIEELQLDGLAEMKSTFFAKFETSKSAFEKQVFEIAAPHLTLEKENKYMKLLDERLAILHKFIGLIMEW